MRQFLTTTGVVAIFDAPWVPLYLLVLFLFHPLLGWLGLVAAVVFFGIAIMNQRVTTEGLRSANELAGLANTQLTRNIRNAEVAASMAIMPSMVAKWGDIQNRLLNKQAAISGVAANFSATTKTLVGGSVRGDWDWGLLGDRSRDFPGNGDRGVDIDRPGATTS